MKDLILEALKIEINSEQAREYRRRAPLAELRNSVAVLNRIIRENPWDPRLPRVLVQRDALQQAIDERPAPVTIELKTISLKGKI